MPSALPCYPRSAQLPTTPNQLQRTCSLMKYEAKLSARQVLICFSVLSMDAPWKRTAKRRSRRKVTGSATNEQYTSPNTSGLVVSVSAKKRKLLNLSRDEIIFKITTKPNIPIRISPKSTYTTIASRLTTSLNLALPQTAGRNLNPGVIE